MMYDGTLTGVGGLPSASIPLLLAITSGVMGRVSGASGDKVVGVVVVVVVVVVVLSLSTASTFCSSRELLELSDSVGRDALESPFVITTVSTPSA